MEFSVFCPDDHSPLAFLMALISSGLLSRSLLTPGAGSFFTVGAILCTLGARQYSCLHPPGARNTFLPNQVMTTKSVLWGRITHHHECNSVPYPLAFCEPVAGPGHGFISHFLLPHPLRLFSMGRDEGILTILSSFSSLTHLMGEGS